MASDDIRNAFRCLLVSGRYFPLPLPTANEAVVVGRYVEGHGLTHSEMVSSFPASLFMAFRWSMYFSQDEALHISSEFSIPRCILVISDRSLPVLLLTVQSKGWSRGLRYRYADNFGVVCDTRQVQQKRVTRSRKPCIVLSFKYTVKFKPQRKVTCKRRIEKTLGHQTFAYLLARWSLSILFASYKLARAAYLEPLQHRMGTLGVFQLSGSVSRDESPSSLFRDVLQLRCLLVWRRVRCAICAS